MSTCAHGVSLSPRVDSDRDVTIQVVLRGANLAAFTDGVLATGFKLVQRPDGSYALIVCTATPLERAQ